MPSCKIVTGYVPLKGNPRSQWEYVGLGGQLMQVDTPIRYYHWPLSDCWLHKHLKDVPPCTHSEGDNPQKNTMAYHIVQHQKTDWLLRAAQEDKETDVFVWIDYGVFHLPGITATVIENFCKRVSNEPHIAIPGCWGIDTPISNANPSWRFCGTVLACPRKHIYKLDAAVKDECRNGIRLNRHVAWEVNTWAKVERSTKLPIRWYSADHNKLLFTNYRSQP